MGEAGFVALLAALAGGVGAVARYLVDSAVMLRVSRKVQVASFPYGTWVVNLSGSLIVGVVAGSLSSLHPLASVLGVGLLGGYTTFSTASFETIRLLQRGRTIAGLLNGVGQLGCAVLLAAAGFGLCSLMAF